MSTCISREGEFSDHEPGDWCPRCGAFNEAGIVAERDRLREQLALGDLYESDAPTSHTRVEADTWAMDCIYGDCDHATDADQDAERPLPACPSSKSIVCQECSDWNSEYEGGIESWPCENHAIQAWQAAGGPERQYDAMVEVFLRGWREHESAIQPDGSTT